MPKNVLYWCLSQLSKEEEEFRQGKEVVKFFDDDENSTLANKFNTLATREDLKVLAKRAKGLADYVQRYRQELDLVLEATPDLPLPRGLSTPSPDVEDALNVLLAYLHWTQGLASSWESPFEKALMKSKGPLYLLIYVWRKVQAPSWSRDSFNSSTDSNKSSAYRLSTKNAQEIAELIHAYSEKEFSREGLSDKIQDCALREPEIFDELVALMDRLDESTMQAVSS